MSERKLSAEEYQRRNEAAWAVVARKYCDKFEFWRDCRYKPCRSARRCVGDQGACLESRCWSIPYDVGVAAHNRMAAQIPPKRRRFHLASAPLCAHIALPARFEESEEPGKDPISRARNDFSDRLEMGFSPHNT